MTSLTTNISGRIFLISASLCLVLTGCGQRASIDENATTQPAAAAPVDHANPKALAQAADQAIRDRDDRALAQCISPEYRKNFSAVLAANRRYVAKLNEIAALAEKRIGPAAAQRLRAEAEQMHFSLRPSPLAIEAGPSPKPDPGSVSMTNEGSGVMFKIDGKYTAFSEEFWIKSVNHGWYIVPHDVPEVFARHTKDMLKAYDQSMSTLKKRQSQIRSGKINADNIDENFWPSTGGH